MTDTAALRASAEKATPGPLEAREVPEGMPSAPLRYGVISHWSKREVCRVWTREDVEFYAQCDPAAILSLLDERDRLRTEAEPATSPRIKPEIIDTLREWAEVERDSGDAERGAAIDAMLDWHDRYRAVRTEADVRVRALEWRTPTDHPGDPDPDDVVFCVEGIGGLYAISRKQQVGPERLLWWAHDSMDWTGFDTIAEAKAAAQADYEKRIRAALQGGDNE